MTIVKAIGERRIAMAARIAIVARVLSGARVVLIPHRAWATTATAAILSPLSHEPSRRLSNSVTPKPNAMRIAAEGAVKAIQASRPPRSPPRVIPTAIPTWLLVGPGGSGRGQRDRRSGVRRASLG